MQRIRSAILEDRYPDFVKTFFAMLYDGQKEKYPDWAVGALKGVGVDLLSS